MSNAMGDRDGLMGAILALTAPPSIGNSDGKNKADKKKATKTQPKELYCECCGDTGDIMLTCHDCTVVSYHPVCDDPPLDEIEVKDKRWQCRSCRNKLLAGDDISLAKVEMELDNVESPEDGENICNPAGMSDPDSDKEENKQDNEIQIDKGTGLPPKRIEEDTSVVQVKKKTRGKKRKATQETKRKAAKLRKLMRTAVRKATSANPALFELPKSFQTNPFNFPGTSRSAIRRPPGTKVKPAVIELENFCTPRPTTCCFKCAKSCRIGPIMQCDYCPKCFHYDCLTPPLTTAPVGMWMCPLHPEHFMEEKMLKTSKMSERVALWGCTTAQVDRAGVELKFLTATQRVNPPFARKIPWPRVQQSTLQPGGGHVFIDILEDESDTIIPFMDKSKLEASYTNSSKKQELYKCYLEAIQNFSDIDLSGSAFAELREIFTRIPQLKPKLDFDLRATTDLDGISNGRGSRHTRGKSKSEPSSKLAEKDKDVSDDTDTNGIDLLLFAASKKQFPSAHEVGNGHWHTNIASYFPFKDPSPLMEILFVDQNKKLSIYNHQVLFGTGKYDLENTAIIDPSKFVDCPRLTGYHALLFFDGHRKQWEMLNYSKHGISVDCSRYVLKPKLKRRPKPNTLQAMKDTILKNRKILIEKQIGSQQPESITEEFSCECYNNEIGRCQNIIDSEGSAPIYLYSQIQIGCLRMIVTNLGGTNKTFGNNTENLAEQS